MDICLHLSHITPNIWLLSSFSQIPLETGSAWGRQESSSRLAACFWSWPKWRFPPSFSEFCLHSCLSLWTTQDFKVIVWNILSFFFFLTNESIGCVDFPYSVQCKISEFSEFITLLLMFFFLLWSFCIRNSLNMFPKIFLLWQAWNMFIMDKEQGEIRKKH